jgi:hypothetical protein
VLEERFDELMKEQVKPYHEQFDVLQQSIEAVLGAYPQCLIADNIKLKLILLNKLKVSSFDTETKEQEFANNALFLLETL